MKTERLHQFTEAPVHRTILPNGLTVVTAQTGSTFVRATLVLRVGSIEDTRPGMAHMLEHLVCHGDAADGVHPLVRPVLIGGAQFNGMTNFVSTSYYIDTLVDKLPEAIDVLLNMVFHADVSARAVEDERGPICAEIRQRNHDDRFGRWLRSCLVPQKPELHNGVGGTCEAVMAMTLDEILTHYEKYYNASNAALVVTGGLEHNAVCGLAERAALRKGLENPVRPEATVALGTFTYTGDDMPPGVAIYFPKPGVQRDSEILDFALQYLIGNQFSPAMQRMRYTHQRIYSGWAGVREGVNPRAGIEVSILPEYFDYAVDTLFMLIKQLQEAQVNEEAWEAHLNRCRRFKLTGIEVYGEPSSYNDWSHLLMDCWLDDDWEVPDRLAFLNAVTPQDAVVAAGRFLRRSESGIVFVDPRS